MADPFIGEIRIFAGNFAPREWAFCNGGTMQVSQNPALFSIVGTIYGGDGPTTFGIPNLQGRLPMQAGQGPGLSNRAISQSSGTTTETLSLNQIPPHRHNLQATSGPAEQASPSSSRLLARSVNGAIYHAGGTLVNMADEAVLPVGGGQAHNNLQPYLALNFIIALNGLFPQRN